MSKRVYESNRDVLESNLFNFVDNDNMHAFIKEALANIDDECKVHPFYITKFRALSVIANAIGESSTNRFIENFNERRGISNIWNAVIEAEPALAKSPFDGKPFTYQDLFSIGHDLAFTDVNGDRNVYDIKMDIDKLYDNEITISEAPVNKLLMVTESHGASEVLAGSVLLLNSNKHEFNVIKAVPVKAYKEVYHVVGPNMVDHLHGNEDGLILVSASNVKVVVMENVVADKHIETIDVDFSNRFNGEVLIKSFLSQINPVGLKKLNINLFFRGNKLSTTAEVRINKTNSSLALIKPSNNKAGSVRIVTAYKVPTANTLEETLDRLFKELTNNENRLIESHPNYGNTLNKINTYEVLDKIDDALNEINNIEFECVTLISGYNRAEFLVTLATQEQQEKLVEDENIIEVVKEILSKTDLKNIKSVHAQQASNSLNRSSIFK